MENRQPLTLLAGDLTAAGFAPPRYYVIYEFARSGLIPVERGANGRWTFDPADLPAIAAGLGLSATSA